MLFRGETISDTLASVLKTDPNWRMLPAAVPPNLRRLLRWCLEKDPKRRLQAIGDARVQLEDLLAGVPENAIATRPPVRRRRMIGAAGAMFAAGAVVAALVHVGADTPGASEAPTGAICHRPAGRAAAQNRWRGA